MGVTLDYSTIEQVAPHVEAAIVAEAARAANSHDWWAEPLAFYPADEPDGRLYGGAKIFLVGYSVPGGGHVSVDPDDNELMAYRDVRFILEQLTEWSERFGLAWVVHCAGERVGTIERGSWDDSLREFLESFGVAADLVGDRAALEDRAKAISTKYASRW